MRGLDTQQAGMFSYLSPEERGPVTHPLRPIRHYVDTALAALSSQLEQLYARTGRPSIAPEKLLRALLLQVLYRLRSERLLREELPYNLLFRWFVGLDLNAPVWDVTVFPKNRERVLAGKVATAFFEQVLAQATAHRLLSDEHCTVDGTLIEAWAGQKSVKQKTAAAPVPPDDPGNPSVDCRGARRTNAAHASTTDPEARLYKKAAGQEAKLCFVGHVLMENRHGLVVTTRRTPATGTAEREAAVALLDARPTTQRITLGGDKNYDTYQFVQDLRAGRSRPMSPSTRRTVPVRLMAGPRAIPATRSVNRSATGSKRFSAGGRRWVCCAKSSSVGCRESAGSSPSRQQSTTWCGGAILWRPRRDPKRSRRAHQSPQRAFTVERHPLMDGLRRLV